ncbi:MAG: endonuclease/exonuclease/phosphatase family protein [Burkholderia sp.]
MPTRATARAAEPDARARRRPGFRLAGRQSDRGGRCRGVLLIGDMNSYAKEDPIALFEARGCVNLAARFIGGDAYNYVFSGETRYLDHALASASLVSRAKVAHE